MSLIEHDDIEPLADWERELLEGGVTIGQHLERVAELRGEELIHPVNQQPEPQKTYRILDLQWREEIASGLTLGRAWEYADIMRWQNPARRLDIRTEFA